MDDDAVCDEVVPGPVDTQVVRLSKADVFDRHDADRVRRQLPTARPHRIIREIRRRSEESREGDLGLACAVCEPVALVAERDEIDHVARNALLSRPSTADRGPVRLAGDAVHLVAR